jgi:hypothetical protein
MTDISDIGGTVRSMIGDAAERPDRHGIDNCIRAALGRYRLRETIKTQCFQLATGGQFALSLATGPARTRYKKWCTCTGRLCQLWR